MKTKNLYRLGLLAACAIATPSVMAQKPADDIPKAGETSPREADLGTGTATETRPDAAPGQSQTTPGQARTTPGQAGAKADSVVAAISQDPSFTTLEKAITASGLGETLRDKSASYTVFAPTDEAFNKLPKGTVQKLLLPENKEQLRKLLMNHVVSGKMTAAQIKSGDIKALSGESLNVNAAGGNVQVQGSAVAHADMMAANGVVHSIDKVIVPKSLEGFEELNQ